MKDFLENNTARIWFLICLIAVSLGIFIDVTYGFIVVLLIGVYCYIVLDDITSNLETFDRFGATFVGFLLHLFCYIVIIALVSSIIDKEEIKESTSYEVKFLENEKIVISRDNNIEMIANEPKLYWECRAKNCKNIIITTVTEKPVNPVFSKDLILKTSTIFTVN